MKVWNRQARRMPWHVDIDSSRLQGNVEEGKKIESKEKDQWEDETLESLHQSLQKVNFEEALNEEGGREAVLLPPSGCCVMEGGDPDGFSPIILWRDPKFYSSSPQISFSTANCTTTTTTATNTTTTTTTQELKVVCINYAGDKFINEFLAQSDVSILRLFLFIFRFFLFIFIIFMIFSIY